MQFWTPVSESPLQESVPSSPLAHIWSWLTLGQSARQTSWATGVITKNWRISVMRPVSVFPQPCRVVKTCWNIFGWIFTRSWVGSIGDVCKTASLSVSCSVSCPHFSLCTELINSGSLQKEKLHLTFFSPALAEKKPRNVWNIKINDAIAATVGHLVFCDS
jgi:hypothetical protein